jgi:hypothetical protein
VCATLLTIKNGEIASILGRVMRIHRLVSAPFANAWIIRSSRDVISARPTPPV